MKIKKVLQIILIVTLNIIIMRSQLNASVHLQ